MSDTQIDRIKSIGAIAAMLLMPISAWFSLIAKIDALDVRLLSVEKKEIPEIRLNYENSVKDGRAAYTEFMRNLTVIERKVDLIVVKFELDGKK